MRKMTVRVRSKDEQTAIVQRLNGTKRSIDQCRALLRALDELVKSRFNEMFGGERYPQIELGTKCKTTSGGTPSTKHPEYYEEGPIPWLTSSEVNKGRIDHPENYISILGLKNSSAKLVPSHTVVVAMYGATAGQIGIVEYETATNQAVCCIPPTEKIVPSYLRFALESRKQWIMSQCSGGAQPNISQGVIRRTRIPYPPLALQQEFADFVTQVDKLRFDVQQQIEKLETLKQSLMQEYFG